MEPPLQQLSDMPRCVRAMSFCLHICHAIALQTFNVLEACVRTGVTRIVNISSETVRAALLHGRYVEPEA